jgi:hypothetical protein
MTRWQSVYRWVGAVGAVGLLLALLAFGPGRHLGARGVHVAPAERRIDTVADLGDDGAADCTHAEIQRGDVAPTATLRPGSTACVLVGITGADRVLRWFFIGRGAGNGTVRVPKPVRVGHTLVTLTNGAAVPIGSTVAVRCSADPNERFESWIAQGKATAGYLDASGALVAIDCDTGN